jgi:diacylglycerol kinase family enzyme
MGSIQGYERCLVVHRPGKSTRRYGRTWRQVNDLVVNHGLDIETYRTSPDRDATVKGIAEAYRPSDLVIVVGGDGTLNTVANAIYSAKDKPSPEILTTIAGTAADCNRSLNSRNLGERALSNVIGNGRLVAVRALQMQIGSADGETHYGVNNAGLNFTGRFAVLLNSEEHRSSYLRAMPFLQNTATYMASLRDRSTMDIYRNGNPVPDTLLDWSAVHSHEAAKYGMFDISHTDDEF